MDCWFLCLFYQNNVFHFYLFLLIYTWVSGCFFDISAQVFFKGVLWWFPGGVLLRISPHLDCLFFGFFSGVLLSTLNFPFSGIYECWDIALAYGSSFLLQVLLWWFFRKTFARDFPYFDYWFSIFCLLVFCSSSIMNTHLDPVYVYKSM